MKVTPKNSQTRKYQVGGAMPAEGDIAAQQAPVAEEPTALGQDPIMMMALMAQQALQGQDCQMAMQVCQLFLEIVQLMQAPQPPQGEPVYRKGGILVKRLKK